MRHHPIVLGAAVAAFVLGSTVIATAAGHAYQDALARNHAVDSTYAAAKQAGANAQKVAPPDLVLPADMGGGTYGQRNMNNGTSTTPMEPTTTMPSNTTPDTGTMPSNGTNPQSKY